MIGRINDSDGGGGRVGGVLVVWRRIRGAFSFETTARVVLIGRTSTDTSTATTGVGAFGLEEGGNHETVVVLCCRGRRYVSWSIGRDVGVEAAVLYMCTYQGAAPATTVEFWNADLTSMSFF